MFRRSASLAFLPLFAASALLVASGCYSTPPRPSGSTVQTSSSPRLEVQSPIDVAIAPLQNGVGRSVPEAALRRAFQKSLVKRRYSPLALDVVDARVVEAGYTPGSLQEGAVLQAKVERWDTSLWESRGAITATIKVELVDANDPAHVLWSGSVADRRFDFPEIHSQFNNDGERSQHVCDMVARELLDALPSRATAPGAARS